MSDAAYGTDDRLALDEERSLPWLESGLEDDDDADGFDTRRIVPGFAVALAAMLAIVAAIWLLTRESGDAAAGASGEVIAAPAGPYKIAPENPGGREFARTGDSAPTAAEGQTRQAQLADGGADVPSAPAPAAASPSAAPAAKPGIGVQIGAYRSRSRAEQAWDELSRSGPLSGRDYRIEEARADIGTVFRLQALAPDSAGANALCGNLRAAGIECQVKN